jgi:hypothetical protein
MSRDKQQNLKAETRRLLAEPVVIRDGRRTRRVSAYEAMWRALSQKAQRGDIRAAEMMFKAAKEFGLLEEKEQQQYSIDLTKLNDEELAVLERLVGKAQILIPADEVA